MNLLYPKFNNRELLRLLGVAFLGASLAGVYGMLHDQITYTVSSEYFSKLKFRQFSYADFGFPAHVFVAEVGFLATWWAGFFSGWFLARCADPAWPAKVARRRYLTGFGIILSTAMLAGLIGHVLGLHTSDFSNWDEICERFEIVDQIAFVRVAYIHNAGYFGGLVGLFTAIAYLRRVQTVEAMNSTETVEVCKPD